MQTVDSIIERLGGVSAAQKRLSIPYTTVASWKARGSIPISVWDRIIAELPDDGLSYDVLMRLNANARKHTDEDTP